jgi:hypothetical protein
MPNCMQQCVLSGVRARRRTKAAGTEEEQPATTAPVVLIQFGGKDIRDALCPPIRTVGDNHRMRDA